MSLEILNKIFCFKVRVWIKHLLHNFFLLWTHTGKFLLFSSTTLTVFRNSLLLKRVFWENEERAFIFYSNSSIFVHGKCVSEQKRKVMNVVVHLLVREHHRRRGDMKHLITGVDQQRVERCKAGEKWKKICLSVGIKNTTSHLFLFFIHYFIFEVIKSNLYFIALPI